MRGSSRLTASSAKLAAFGGLALLVCAADARAEGASAARPPVTRVAAVHAGAIHGVVQDDHGSPVIGALVSAIGATKAFAVTDRRGRFELPALPAGSYLLRAHSSGFIASNSQTIAVRAAGRVASSIELKRATRTVPSTTTAPAASQPILQAGVGLPGTSLGAPEPQPVPRDETATDAPPGQDDHGELAWRLRHLRRSVLQEATDLALIGDAVALPAPDEFAAPGYGRAAGSPARLAANVLTGTPFSGEFNFLTTSTFDSPQQLFRGDLFARGIAYMSVGAPAGSHADWAVRGALSQADISSWVVAGTYSTRGAARHHYDIGLSYATQRYDGGNPAALRGVTDGSRNAGAVYGFDTWTLSPAVAVTYGARYARYDYLTSKGLISPRLSMTLSAGEHVRVNATASRRSIAPGAEEFLPPSDAGLWLPPQRTFSSVATGGALEPEHTTNVEIELERDLGASSAVTLRAFQQYVADQIVTLFGLDLSGLPPANLGHYFVGNDGDVDARGVAAAYRTRVAGRVSGSVEYTTTQASWQGRDNLGPSLARLEPNATVRSERIHDLSTSIQTDVPETSTRVVVLYRLSNAFARPREHDASSVDSRFDLQIHQSLPFMDFSTAKWEMLVGIRNFFRETAPGQSVFDELLVLRPPKRIVGGLTMRF